MFVVKITGQFKKDVELCRRRGLDMILLRQAISILSETGTLPESYHPHKFRGKYAGHWEAHLQPDWIVVWKTEKNALVMTMIATGSHADLFE